MKLIDLLREIVVKPSGTPVPQEVRDQIDTLISNFLPKTVIREREDIGDPLTILTEEQEDMVFDFVKDHMIASNYEILSNGEETLVSHSNKDLVSEDEVREYIQQNPGLERFLNNLIWTYCVENIDVDNIKKEAYKEYLDNVEGRAWLPHPDEWFLDQFKYSITSKNWLYDYVDFYDTVRTPEFSHYLYSTLLKADLP